MVGLRGILMILAVICLCLAAVGVQAPRVNLMAMGLAFWSLAVLLA